MGIVSESFANLNEFLTTELKKSKKTGLPADLVLQHLLKPFLPMNIRCTSGTVTDITDRQAGPFDVIASLDAFPAFGEGSAATVLADGAVFALQVRNWAESDLTQFGDLARQLKKLERKKKGPVPCFAISFARLALAEVSQFLNSRAGQPVDGVLCIGHHVVLRNSSGAYGNPERVPFVTEPEAAEALKAFTFFLLKLSQEALGRPFGLADYQHL